MDNKWVIGAIVVVAVLYFTGTFGGQSTTTTGTTGTTSTTTGSNSQLLDTVKSTISTTVTFKAWDALQEGTAPGLGHRLLSFDGEKNTIVTDGATKTSAPGVAYKVLIGNRTTGVAAYYPAYKEGVVATSTADSISKGLYHIDTNPTFVYTNANGQVDTAQALTTSDTKTVAIKITAASKQCFGNKDAADQFGTQNTICFMGNASPVYNKIELQGAASAYTPNSVAVASSDRAWCYKIPVICDNGEYNGKVIITTGTVQPNAIQENISVSLSDGTYDFNDYSLELIKDVQDENGNDIGQTDLGGTKYAYDQIAVS